jgi:Flp pilus assembly pilin Flp
VQLWPPSRVLFWILERSRKIWRAKQGNVFIENGIWIIIVVLAMIVPIEALRNALTNAFGQITQNLNSIP